MLVFSEEWLQKLKTRFGNHQPYDRPSIFHYATLPIYEDLRDEIEIWVSQLTIHEQSKIIPRLREKNSFLETYNDLVTADVLRKLGHQVKYESKFSTTNNGDLTPDWLVRTKYGDFILEGFTFNPPDEAESERKRWGIFFRRIQTIPVNAFINIKYNDSTLAPDQTEIKQITKLLSEWLKDDALIEGATIHISDFKFTFLNKTDHESVKFMVSPIAFAAGIGNETKLINRLQIKANRYKDIDLPLVISIVPNFFAWLDLEDVQNAILGTEAWLFDWDNPQAPLEAIRQNDGFFYNEKYNNPNLSAVIYIPKRLGKPLPMYQVGIFPNPQASKPLSVEVFKTPK